MTYPTKTSLLSLRGRCWVAIWMFIIVPFTEAAQQDCVASDELVGSLSSTKAFPIVIEPGYVKTQFNIDHAERGLDRLHRTGLTRDVQVERLPGWGRKKIWSLGSGARVVTDVVIYFNFRVPTQAGVRISKLEVGANGRGIDLIHASLVHHVYEDGAYAANLDREDGALVVRPSDASTWRRLRFELPTAIEVDKHLAIDSHMKTLYFRPWSLENLLSGSRVDACVYFVLRGD